MTGRHTALGLRMLSLAGCSTEQIFTPVVDASTPEGALQAILASSTRNDRRALRKLTTERLRQTIAENMLTDIVGVLAQARDPAATVVWTRRDGQKAKAIIWMANAGYAVTLVFIRTRKVGNGTSGRRGLDNRRMEATMEPRYDRSLV